MKGSILMFTENLFNSGLETEEELDIQTCSTHNLDMEVSIIYQENYLFIHLILSRRLKLVWRRRTTPTI